MAVLKDPVIPLLIIKDIYSTRIVRKAGINNVVRLYPCVHSGNIGIFREKKIRKI